MGRGVCTISFQLQPTELLREARHGYLCTLETYSSSNVENGLEGKETRKETSCEAITVFPLRGEVHCELRLL